MRLVLFLFLCMGLGLWGFSSAQTSFPLVFQSPSYLLEKTDTTRSSYTCDTTKGDCKVNFLFFPNASGTDADTAWECVLDFGMASPTGQENKCNPSTVVFSGASSFSVTIRARKKGEEIYGEQILTIFATGEASSGSTGISSQTGGTQTSSGSVSGTAGAFSSGTTQTESQTQTGASADTASGVFVSGSGGMTGGTSGSGEISSGIPFSGSVSGGETSSGTTSSGGVSGSSETLSGVTSSGVSGTGGSVFSSGTETSSGSTGNTISSGSSLSGGISGSSSGTGASGGTTMALTGVTLLVQSGLTPSNVCTKQDCVVNFSSSFAGTLYSCAWDLGGGYFSSSGSAWSCNPGYAHFPKTQNYTVALRVIRLKDAAVGSAEITVINPYTTVEKVSYQSVVVTPAPSSTPAPTISNTGALPFSPVATIHLQGALGKNKWQDGKTVGCELVGDQTGCVLNFDGRMSRIFDEEKAKMEWQFGFSGGSYLGKNPGFIHFPVGKWKVVFRVSDPYGTAEDVWWVAVGTQAQEKTETGTFSVTAGTIGEALVRSPAQNTQEEDRWAEEDFSVQILAQGVRGKNRIFSDGNYVCRTDEDVCSVNLTASGSGKSAKRWIWNFGNGEVFSGKNPAAILFPKGSFVVSLLAVSRTGNVAQDFITVAVQDMQKKPKKTSRKSEDSSGVGDDVSRDSVQNRASSGVISGGTVFPVAASRDVSVAAMAASLASGVSWVLGRFWSIRRQ